MKKTYLGIAILTIIVGLLMLFAPEAWTKVIVILLGATAILNGIYNLYYVRTIISDANYRKVIIIRGILSIVIGILAIILPLAIAATIWNIMLYILGAYLLISAGLEIYATMKLKNNGIELKPYYGEIIGSIILAIILFLIPITLGLILIRICGAILILFGIGVIIWEWKNRNTAISVN